jgi:hypothetical protein
MAARSSTFARGYRGKGLMKPGDRRESSFLGSSGAPHFGHLLSGRYELPRLNDNGAISSIRAFIILE